jgi:chromodomain-helicase-DNA-binding protein 7
VLTPLPHPFCVISHTARCHRIGQRSEVKVYRLIARNTYEKYIFTIASRKLGLERVVLREAEKNETLNKEVQ